MSHDNGRSDPSDEETQPTQTTQKDGPEEGVVRFVYDSDYIRAIDEAAPGAADRILRILEEQQVSEEKYKERTWALRLSALILLTIAGLAVIGVSVYLIVRGEKAAGQTILAASSIVVTIVNLGVIAFYRWHERPDEPGKRSPERTTR